MPLSKRVTKPKEEERPRLKLLLFGATGVGKTTASMWPNAYLIDGEHGTDHYDELLAERGCARAHIADVDELNRELQALMTEKHDYQTVVVDPITPFYEDSQAKWTDRYTTFHADKGEKNKAAMQDFGPGFWGKIRREQKSLITMLKRIQMNVVVTAHEKPMYAPGAGLNVVGVTYDGLKGLDYMFDTVLRLALVGDNRVAYTQKDRTHKFPPQFDYNYDAILKLWGESLTQAAEPIVLATPAQVERITALLAVVQVGDNWVDDCLRRAEAETWAEVESTKIGKAIKFLEAKIPTQPTNGDTK